MFHIREILNGIMRKYEQFTYLKRYFMNINSMGKKMIPSFVCGFKSDVSGTTVVPNILINVDLLGP